MAPGITIEERHRGSELTAGWDLPGFDVEAFVSATLAEDLGEAGDITSTAVIPADARFTGVMDSRDPGRLLSCLDPAQYPQGPKTLISIVSLHFGKSLYDEANKILKNGKGGAHLNTGLGTGVVGLELSPLFQKEGDKAVAAKAEKVMAEIRTAQAAILSGALKVMNSSSSTGGSSPARPALVLDGVTVQYDTVKALSDVSIAFEEGRIHAVVGQNGAGKTTFARVCSGLVKPTQGRVRIGEHEIRTGHVNAARAAG
eukprot:gene380-550_t